VLLSHEDILSSEVSCLRGEVHYEGLHAKAASTGFPEEADACRAKAEQLRAKYGI
jgi:hypothetical protein